MVNVVENRAQVALRPLSTPTPGPAEGWLVCPVSISESSDVDGYPNLLAADLPREVQALIKVSTLEDLAGVDRWLVVASLVAPGRLRIEDIVG